jgi:hypothetical protein
MRQGFSRGRRDAQVALFRFRPRSQEETPPVEDEGSGSVALILASSTARCVWRFPHSVDRPGMRMDLTEQPMRDFVAFLNSL